MLDECSLCIFPWICQSTLYLKVKAQIKIHLVKKKKKKWALSKSFMYKLEAEHILKKKKIQKSLF